MRHRLHPLVWLSATAVVIVESYLLEWDIVAIGAVLLVSAFVLSSDNRKNATGRLVLLFVPLAIAALVVSLVGQSANSERVWYSSRVFAIGPDRLRLVTVLWARAVSILAIGLACAERATPSALRRWTADLRLPPSTARILLGARGFLLSVRASTKRVADAQSIRGLPIQGSVLQRAQALPLLAVPLMANLFVEAAHRSVALDRRGFADYYGDLPPSAPLRAVDVILLTISIAILPVQFAI